MKSNEIHPRIMESPNILYIMGAGRSGTTIMEILLANNPGITGVGELTHVFRDHYKKNIKCSCGKSAASCSFWEGILHTSTWNDDEIDILIQTLQKVESHATFMRLFFRFCQKTILQRYFHINKHLFNKISLISKTKTIIDSSKYAGRGLALLRLFPNYTKIIWMTRPPEQLVKSFHKKGLEQPSKTLINIIIYDFYVTFCCSLVALKHPASVYKLEYEDFIKNFEKTLSEVEKWADIDLSLTKSLLTNNSNFKVGHIITGNRLRKKKVVKFNPDTGPKDLNAPERLASLTIKFNRTIIYFFYKLLKPNY